MAELMRQVVVSRRGGPEVLAVRQAPVLQTPLGSSQ